MFKKLRNRLPKKKTAEELEKYYSSIKEVGLEKGDLCAMLIAAFFTLGIPLIMILVLIYLIIWKIFL